LDEGGKGWKVRMGMDGMRIFQGGWRSRVDGS